ncbi:fungal-specific transcription factor domain-containing protein [Penicillium riverlandense]|uniref:fungal-specific transcription factor domain-containing protein n=1 Tax=Penicillium riverlandense TaxID=1903569 RepID=UPI00254852A1|nr:fungal-specific transcription factor domain-containing protein [Penicillium riverlandense]KAJ5812201.1 fungal-specific transcription factor domain-containing protein [Penicillium riverlandense]
MPPTLYNSSEQSIDRDFDCVYDERRTREILQSSSYAESSFHHTEGSAPASDSVEEQAEQSRFTHEHTYRRNDLYAEEDGVSAQNKHTTGTEFYGNSSNFALLNQLVSCVRGLAAKPAGSTLDTVQAPSSIVEIFYDEQSHLQDPVPASPVTVAGRTSEFRPSHKVDSVTRDSQTPVNPGESNPTVSQIHQINQLPSSWGCFIGTPMRLEMEYVYMYFENIHNIHPFLSKADFVARCRREVWTRSSVKQLHQDKLHFLSLYNAVLSVAALTAGTHALSEYRNELDKPPESSPQNKPPSTPPSSLLLSRLYFWRARRLLGDIFEVSSIDSAQALLLMSVYCQHALKTHACYMYSGMAARTAIAIGISREGNLGSRRTWWAIYAQDMEISCSSGRSSSLAEPSDYPVPYPQSTNKAREDKAEETDATSQDSIIASLVESSVILQQTSKRLYHNHEKLSLKDKSQIAFELDSSLEIWRSGLPALLDWDMESFNEPEWATKQKLHLQLRFYNIRMFIHRPFFSNTTSEIQHAHVRICLEAAQNIINLLYNAYQHRYYFRTWWYNSTYTLYASMIILYVILIDPADPSVDELFRHIRRALKILDAMKELRVAKRCGDLITEILQVTTRYVESRRRSRVGDFRVSPVPDGNSGAYNSNQADLSQPVHVSGMSEEQPHQITDAEAHFFGGDPESPYFTRQDILACLEDTRILENFAVGLDNEDCTYSDMASVDELRRGGVRLNPPYAEDETERMGQWSWT